MRNVININKDWLFFKDCKGLNNDINLSIAVDLPHTWNGKDGQDGGNDYFRGVCLYKKVIRQEELIGEKHYLEICGANSSGDVYVNGKHLAHHNGGYSTWRVEFTEVCQENNEICIFVDNSPNDEVYPQTADFTFYGGLYRDVNIISVSNTHVDLDYYGGCGVKVTPLVQGNDANVEFETFVKEYKDNDLIRYEIKDHDGNIIHFKESNQCKELLMIPSVHLWDGIDDPYLYTFTVSILRNNEVIDSVNGHFGCRTFEVDPEKGFILNGHEYPLRGVSRHQDRNEIGNALLHEHHDEDMELIKEVGANTIRLAHYQHDQYFYDLCDKEGMIIWAEIPYISRHIPEGNENTISQMKELIVQNYNHPCIVVWGLSNEITMDGAKDSDLIENHKVLNKLCHEMDQTRLTTIACLSTCGMDEEYVHIPDLVSYNHYYGWYGGSCADNGPWFDKFHAKYPKLPIGCSEYGCEGLNWHTSKPEQGDYTEEYQAYYHEELIKQLFTRQYIWSTYVWNMFDFGADARAEGGENGQNHKGLITIDRKYKKDAFYAYKAWLSKDPFVHICGKRYVDRVEAVTKVTVYSNLDEVELFANGVSLGKQTSNVHFFYFDVPNIGTTELVAFAGEYKDSSRINKVEVFNDAYRLKEQGAVLNWFDITEVEGYFSLNDKISDIIKTFRGKLWFAGLFIDLAKKQMPGKQPKKDKPKQKKKKSKKKGVSVDSGTMDMIGSFTVLRFTGLLTMRNIHYSKEELLKMNAKLNKIKKL